MRRMEIERLVLVPGAVIVVGLVVGFFRLAGKTSFSTWGVVLVGLMLFVLSLPVIRSTARLSDDPMMTRILLLAVLAKMVGAFLRFSVNADVYGGQADASAYHAAAAIAAPAMRHFVFTLSGTGLQGHPEGTQAVGWVLAVIYALLGVAKLTGFLVFSWIGWLGAVMFYRAFRMTYPDVRSRPCALLLFFLPSLVYWPSSPGKEALIVFLLGLAALGLAHLFTGRQPFLGALEGVAGVAGILRIRPHIALILLVGVVAAALVRRKSPDPGTRRSGTIGRILVLVLVVPGIVLALSRIDQVFGNETTNGNSIASVLQHANAQTSTGNSQFEARPVKSPLDFPVALTFVTLRPFPWQATSPVTLVASFEGVLLVGLLIGCRKAVGRALKRMRTEPFAALSGAFVLAFVYAFSNIANAGILVRQRAQMFPFLLILMASGARPIADADPSAGHLADGAGHSEGSTEAPVIAGS